MIKSNKERYVDKDSNGNSVWGVADELILRNLPLNEYKIEKIKNSIRDKHYNPFNSYRDCATKGEINQAVHEVCEYLLVDREEVFNKTIPIHEGNSVELFYEAAKILKGLKTRSGYEPYHLDYITTLEQNLYRGEEDIGVYRSTCGDLDERWNIKKDELTEECINARKQLTVGYYKTYFDLLDQFEVNDKYLEDQLVMKFRQNLGNTYKMDRCLFSDYYNKHKEKKERKLELLDSSTYGEVLDYFIKTIPKKRIQKEVQKGKFKSLDGMIKNYSRKHLNGDYFNDYFVDSNRKHEDGWEYDCLKRKRIDKENIKRRKERYDLILEDSIKEEEEYQKMRAK